MDPTETRASRPEAQAAEAGADGSSGAGCAGFYTAHDARRQRRFNVWMFAMALAYVGATAALRWRESIPRVVPWLLAGLTLLLAILAVRGYLVFLRGADELLRRIQTEALAVGFGLGAVFSLFYPLLEGLGAPALGGHATALVMMLSWAAGSWLATRRYAGSRAA
jgi:hypothetical protein